MKRMLVALLVLMSVMSLAAAQVNYMHTEQWDGQQGIDSKDCDSDSGPYDDTTGWIHWIVTQSSGVTEAQLVLGGSGSGTYDVDKVSGGALHFYTPYYDLDSLTATMYYNGALGNNPQFTISHYCPGDNGDGGTGGDDDPVPIPEFPTVALPIAAILGLAFFFQRRKE
jgi:hypothetical protein